ncbi:unnamed protein product [Paramecium pentaurelia]|uniref:Uncharacterized protein n=1 Tax=Paramecium pentaurelia TaxID=43138 RepID=A0A8S1UPC9_9CILI|nr:unnamed protein product [Paramecium pentaurelia]
MNYLKNALLLISNSNNKSIFQFDTMNNRDNVIDVKTMQNMFKLNNMLIMCSVIQFIIRFEFSMQLQFRVLLEQKQLFLIFLILFNL